MAEGRPNGASGSKTAERAPAPLADLGQSRQVFFEPGQRGFGDKDVGAGMDVVDNFIRRAGQGGDRRDAITLLNLFPGFFLTPQSR